MINPMSSTPVGPDAGSTGRDLDSSAIEIMLLLNGETSVSMVFFDSILKQVEDSLPGMNPDQSYTAKQMCGNDCWNQMTRPQHLLAGKCIAHMVSEGRLPLDFAKPTAANARRYRLK